MEFTRQEYWSGYHSLLQGIFPTQGSNPSLPALQADSLPSVPPGKSLTLWKVVCFTRCGIVVLLASSACPLMEEAKRLVQASWWLGKLGLALVGTPLLIEALIQLSADEWVFCSLPSSCLAWGDPALSSMVGLLATSKRVYTKGDLPSLLLPVSLPMLGPCWPTPPQETLTPAGGFGSVSRGVATLFLWVLVCAWFCCALQDWSLCFPQSCGSLVIKSRWPSRSDSLGIPSPFIWSPGWEAWRGVLNLHNSRRTSLVLQFLRFSSLWVTHQAGMGFNSVVIVALLLSCCGCCFVFECGVSFLVGSSVLLSMVVQQLLVTLVFSQEEMSAHPSSFLFS